MLSLSYSFYGQMVFEKKVFRKNKCNYLLINRFYQNFNILFSIKNTAI